MGIVISYREELKRKAVHLSSLWMVAATLLIPRWFPEYGRWISCGLFALLLIITLVSEHDYANNGRYLGKLYGILFCRMLRKEVKPGQWIVSGGAFVLASALLANLLFIPVIAAGGLAVMLTGDAAAALIGRKFGRHPAPNGKSWEGVMAFILVGYGMFALVMALSQVPGYFYLAGIPAVILAAVAELFEKQLHLDDNFSIPLCVGAVLALTVWLVPPETAAGEAGNKITDALEKISNNIHANLKGE